MLLQPTTDESISPLFGLCSASKRSAVFAREIGLWLMLAFLCVVSQGVQAQPQIAAQGAANGALSTPQQTQNPAAATQEVTLLRLVQEDNRVLLFAQTKFELSSAIEESLYKGVAITFVADVEIVRERWYWTNKKLVQAQRRTRLSYQTLTRKWRVQTLSDATTTAGQGIQVPQLFDVLDDALSAIQRISGWHVLSGSELDGGAKHQIDFRFKLDVTQLPRPLQIGLLGHAEWSINMNRRESLVVENKP